MKDAQKPDHISLRTLIGRLKEGRFVIPDFQREFEWQPWDIRDLMRSIFLDYYIGSLLLWSGKPENFRALACEPIYGYQGIGTDAEHIVLDGQQRLTAMYYAFVAPDMPAPNRANRYLYFIQVQRFMEMAYDEAFRYDWTRGGLNLLGNTTQQYQNHMFPLSVIGRGGWELPNWVQGYEAYWRSKAAAAQESGDAGGAETALRCADDAKAFGEHLKEITEQYQVAYVELDRELALDKVCDIFTQVNSKGIRLDVFDLINALLKPKGMQLKHMWRNAAPQLDFVETERMNVYILQVMSILRQAYCSPKYLYYLLPQQEKLVRDPDGSLRKEMLVKDTARVRGPLGQRGRGAAQGHRPAPPPAGVRSHLLRVPAVRLHPARLRGVAGAGDDAPAKPPARRPAEDTPLVLGERLHQPLLGLGRVHRRARLP